MTLPAAEAQPHYIMLGYLRGLFDYLRSRGASIGPVLELMELPESELRNPDIRVPHALQNDLFDIAVSLMEEIPQVLEVKQFIARNLRGAPPGLAEAAAALAISTRTLQRRLESIGLNYRELTDMVRRELAESYLRDKSLSQIDVAFLLGYSEQSAFHRAFRRWFEITPGEFRARLSSRHER